MLTAILVAAVIVALIGLLVWHNRRSSASYQSSEPPVGDMTHRPPVRDSGPAAMPPARPSTSTTQPMRRVPPPDRESTEDVLLTQPHIGAPIIEPTTTLPPQEPERDEWKTWSSDDDTVRGGDTSESSGTQQESASGGSSGDTSTTGASDSPSPTSE